MPARSSRTQVPLSHCVKKAPQHIAAVSQDEWMTLAADAGALLFRVGIRLPSLAQFWPLGESPVLAVGMLWLTCLVTRALTPAAALHSVLDVYASSHSDCWCERGLWGSCIGACKYACSMQYIFVCVSSEVVLTLDTCCLIKECVRCWWSPPCTNPRWSKPYRLDRSTTSCLSVCLHSRTSVQLLSTLSQVKV